MRLFEVIDLKNFFLAKYVYLSKINRTAKFKIKMRTFDDNTIMTTIQGNSRNMQKLKME